MPPIKRKTRDRSRIYNINGIVGFSIRNRKIYYLTSWEGYPGEQTLEPEEHFLGTEAKRTLNAFKRSARFILKRALENKNISIDI